MRSVFSRSVDLERTVPCRSNVPQAVALQSFLQSFELQSLESLVQSLQLSIPRDASGVSLSLVLLAPGIEQE